MKLTYDEVKQEFQWIGGYNTRMQPKSAGFRWNPTDKHWWTNSRERAHLLRKYADAKAKAELGDFEAEKMPYEQREAIHLCLKMLASMCDWAVTEDGQGFSKSDTTIGHQLARKDAINSEQAAIALPIIRIHQHQLPVPLLLTARAIRGKHSNN